MGSKMKIQGLNTMHTAGIFSDMSVDGPEIGTLVVIVDRAKNLPNRKTIGKQDPYCAARLGKEAKKTETDRRGGQTPRWDQELRYTVHDSPDYYQLKVSIFNDDKKTDLIGETWVDLKDVIIPGGGQNDLWHSLSCKGKYAGEIRVEITYYDSRPKQEKPEKAKQNSTNTTHNEPNESHRGSRPPKSGVKRRPLPSDPITGKPATTFSPPVQHLERNKRSMSSSDIIADEPASVSSMRLVDQIETSPTFHENSQPPHHSYKYHHSEIPDHIQNQPREYQFSPSTMSVHAQTPRSYQKNSSAVIPEQYRISQGKYTSSNHITHKPSMQNFEHDRPSYFASKGYENYTNTSRESLSTTLVNSSQRLNDHYEIYDSMPRNGFDQITRTRRSETENSESRDYNQRKLTYDIPPAENFGPSPSPGGPPPRPPAHRSRNTTNNVSSFPDSCMISTDGHSPNHYAESALISRNPIPPHNRSNSYQAYSPERDQERYSRSSSERYEESLNQDHSFDSRYANDYGSMQPTVEDAPPSPSSTRFQFSYHEDKEKALSGCSNSTPPSSQKNVKNLNSQIPTNSKSQVSYRNRTINEINTPQPPSGEVLGQNLNSRIHSEHQVRDSIRSGAPQVPATLLPGMDPVIAQEISDKIYVENQASFCQDPDNFSQEGNQSSSRPPQGQPYREKNLVPNPNMSPNATPVHSASDNSSNSRRTMTRKSISSSPSRPENQKRLSGIPYGPDSYNSLNPIVTASSSNLSLSAAYNTNEEQESKIITHDGREVDPSDHIPESNYAPLPETKNPKNHEYKSTPSNQQLPRPVGRRPLQQATRPRVSTATPIPSISNSNSQGPPNPHVGRVRLQKISARVNKPAKSTSSLPITTANFESSSNDVRLNHSFENYTQSDHGNSSGNFNTRASAPPTPPKILPANVTNDHWSLVQEMQNVDLRGSRISRRNY